MVLDRENRLDPVLDPARDHVLGDPASGMVLVEYGSYACPSCREANSVVARLRDHFGERLCYVFRHRPISTDIHAHEAAELAEIASATDQFWPVHSALMGAGPDLTPQKIARIADAFDLPAPELVEPLALDAARARIEEDIRSARSSGALVAPTFYINNRRYQGPWDESSLGEALEGSLGFRARTAGLDFVRWGPSAGILLLLMSVLAVGLANSSLGPSFERIWSAEVGLGVNGKVFSLPFLTWVNDGLLSIFFLVVGLEIKREFTIGQLATRRAAALPIAAAFGGMILPATLFALLAPAHLAHGWGTTIATDTAFAIALILFLGDRVPVELRVFLTATAIIDDLVAIGVVALFYSDALVMPYLVASALVTCLLVIINRWNVYHPVPYAVLGLLLWFCLHEAGIHATLAGVILALVTPTRPPPNLRALNAQAQLVFRVEARADKDMPHQGPSEPALHMLNTIHSRLESPAAKLLRVMEPWSSYAVLPLFALANAGVLISVNALQGHGSLMLAIIVGLAFGKPAGIFCAAWLAVRQGWATKPEAYTWRQLTGAGMLAGIGFTMSLFIAGQAFEDPAEFAAAKIAIFLASLIAGLLGVCALWRRAPDSTQSS
jgi:NhaA family Na+:H+ antiporter